MRNVILKKVILLLFICLVPSFAHRGKTFSEERLSEFQDIFLEEERGILHESGVISIPITDLLPVNIPGFALIQINNNTGLSDHSVFIVVKGQNQAGNQCYLQIPNNGLGVCSLVSSSSLSQNFSYRLSRLPGDSTKRFFYIPNPFISGRVYFSVDYPLLMEIKNSTIVDPDPFNPKDPNYYFLYDKFELTYDPPVPVPGVNFYTNPTAVDFFSLPICLQMVNPVGTSTESGLNLSRNTVLSGVQSTFNILDKTMDPPDPLDRVWSRLFLPFVDDPLALSPTTITNMRIVAPSKAAVSSSNNPAHEFPLNYLDGAYGFDYISNVWDFYKGTGKKLRINTIEIATKFGPGPGTPDYYKFTGTVNGSDEFVFINDTSNFTWKMPKQTSCAPFFAGAGFGGDSEANNTPGAIIVRQFSSAFDVGLLPVDFPDGAFDFMDQAYFLNQKGLNNYYTSNTEWGAPGASNGPFFDLYSKALHSFGELIYTFAYDDELGQDGTLGGNVEKEKSSLMVTLGSVDTPIPNPFEDDNTYTVNFNAAGNNPVKYRNSSSGPFLSAPPFPTTVSGIKANKTTPFQIMLKGADGSDQILTVYLKYDVVISQVSNFDLALGVLINHGSPATDVTLVTPAK